MFATGIQSKYSLDILADICTNIDNRSRNVVLIFDAIHIRKELAYNKHRDIVEGYADTGIIRTNEVATEITLFMVRSIFGSWKFNISYFASKNGFSAEELYDLLLKNLARIQVLGLKVRAVISDQGAANRGAFRNVGISLKEPYAIVDNEKIIFFCTTLVI